MRVRAGVLLDRMGVKSSWADRETVGTRLRKARINKNISVKKLADSICCAETTIFGWMGGKSYPPPGTIAKMAELFGCQEADITTQGESPLDSLEVKRAVSLWQSEEQAAERINGLLRERGWSRNMLAGKMGVTMNTIQNWCSGKHVPGPQAIQRLAKLFGVSEEELTNGD